MSKRTPRPLPSRDEVVTRGPHPRRRKWTAQELGYLGKLPDAAVARKIGIHPLQVLFKRRRRGIEAFRPRRPSVDWTERMIALLGQFTDRSVAEELGLSESIVQRKRQLLGIAPLQAPRSRRRWSHHWSALKIALLGKYPDKVVAKRLRISESCAARKRRLLEISPYREAVPAFVWTKKSLALLGSRPDGEVAELLGISAGTVRSKRYDLKIDSVGGSRARWVVRKPALRAILKLPVKEVCRRFGLSTKTVAKIRAEFGLTVHRWSPEEDGLLGAAPDPEVAARLGINVTALRSRRRRLGIPRFSRSAAKQRQQPSAS